MDELQTIREALRLMGALVQWSHHRQTMNDALEALSRLEVRAAEWPDLSKVIDKIMNKAVVLDQSGTANEWIAAKDLAILEISQYAYRYSEDIRKDRDEWKAMAEQFSAVIMKKLKE